MKSIKPLIYEQGYHLKKGKNKWKARSIHKTKQTLIGATLEDVLQLILIINTLNLERS